MRLFSFVDLATNLFFLAIILATPSPSSQKIERQWIVISSRDIVQQTLLRKKDHEGVHPEDFHTFINSCKKSTYHWIRPSLGKMTVTSNHSGVGMGTEMRDEANLRVTRVCYRGDNEC